MSSETLDREAREMNDSFVVSDPEDRVVREREEREIDERWGFSLTQARRRYVVDVKEECEAIQSQIDTIHETIRVLMDFDQTNLKMVVDRSERLSSKLKVVIDCVEELIRTFDFLKTKIDKERDDVKLATENLAKLLEVAKTHRAMMDFKKEKTLFDRQFQKKNFQEAAKILEKLRIRFNEGNGFHVLLKVDQVLKDWREMLECRPTMYRKGKALIVDGILLRDQKFVQNGYTIIEHLHQLQRVNRELGEENIRILQNEIFEPEKCYCEDLRDKCMAWTQPKENQ